MLKRSRIRIANKEFGRPVLGAELKRSTSTPRSQNSQVEDRELLDPVSLVFMSVTTRKSQALVDPSRDFSWLKLRRIQALVDWFIKNCQKPKADRTAGDLSLNELTQKEIKIVKGIQHKNFPEFQGGYS